MQLHALKHLVEAVQVLSQCEQIVVLGSSSLLPSFPDMGKEGGPLALTYDADFLVEPIDPVTASLLAESLGPNSLFEVKNGYHADIAHPDITSTLPPGWEERLVPLEGFDRAFCLAPLDLAVVKVLVGREKDLELVKGLLVGGRIDPSALRERFHTLPLGERELFRAGKNLNAVLLQAESKQP